MNRFVLALALRESRSRWNRIVLDLGSSTLGMAAIVSIHSFRRILIESVQQESRTRLGADLRLSSRRPFTAPVQALIDSAGTRYQVATMTSLVSMASAPKTQRVRMVQ